MKNAKSLTLASHFYTMKRFFAFFGLIVMFLAIPQDSFGQDEREQKAVEEREKKKEKSQEEVEKELIKRHLKMQSKETRKRIKRSRREAERRKKGKHPQPWWDRWFSRKQQTKRRKKT